MFVAVVLVCAQAIVQNMRDCTAETANQIVKLEQTFFTEDECMNRGARLGRSMLPRKMNSGDKIKVVCEPSPSDSVLGQ
jgi:hypothetical protein